jgi:RNA polymerase sigma-70 factor (ECF subfamily)
MTFKKEELKAVMPVFSALARKLTKNEHDAEDLKQNTFVRMIEKEHTYNGSASLKTWGCRIMFNLFYDQMRSRKVTQDIPTDFDTKAPHELMVMQPTQENKAFLNELDTYLDQMTPRRQEVMERVMQGYTGYEIAAQLKIDRITVGTTLYGARQQLKDASL